MRTREKDRFTIRSGELISEAESELRSIRSMLGSLPWLGEQGPERENDNENEVGRYSQSLNVQRRTRPA